MSTGQKLQTISTNNTIIAENEQKVYDAGKQAERKEWWGNFQNYGEPMSYQAIFSNPSVSIPYPWNENTFNPKYQIKPTNALDMFYRSAVKDCQAILDIDFSQCTTLASAFESAYYITHLGIIDARNATNLTSMIKYSGVVTIDKLILKDDGSQNMSQFANFNSVITNIVIEGVIGTSTDFNDSNKLTHDSLMSIINALKDYSEDTSGKTYKLELGKTNLGKLTDEEKAIATQKGWTLA